MQGSVFTDVVSEDPLQGKPGLFQHPPASGIISKRLGINPHQIFPAGERFSAKLRDSPAQDGMPPIRLSQPIADLRRPFVNILVAENPDASHRGAVCNNGAGDLAVLPRLYAGINIGFRVLPGIGLREYIPQPSRNMGIIRILRHRRDIPRLPGAE